MSLAHLSCESRKVGHDAEGSVGGLKMWSAMRRTYHTLSTRAGLGFRRLDDEVKYHTFIMRCLLIDGGCVGTILHSIIHTVATFAALHTNGLRCDGHYQLLF